MTQHGDGSAIDLLELRSTLTAVLGSGLPLRDYWDGPRTWWAGALDVEGLALGAIGTAIQAVDALTNDTDHRARLRTTSRLVSGAFGSIGHLRVDDTPASLWAPMSGFHRTADGWIRVHANYPHHARALLDALKVQQPDQLVHALREFRGGEAEQSITAAGGVAAVVEPPPQRGELETGPWIEFTTRPAPGAATRRLRSAPDAQSRALPLRGVRVLELTRVLAGPSGGKTLGLLGADVLRIDPPHRPELLDAHIDTGFDKRSATADLRMRSQRAAVRRLLGDADVILLGYRPGALAAFGLDPDTLRVHFPHLIVVSMNAWEPSGDRAGRRGFDSIVQAASGIAHIYGRESEGSWRPGSLPVQALDYATGFGVAAAAIALLASRTRGMVGTAQLSLERTARLLTSAPTGPTTASARELPVRLRTTDGPYGRLDYVSAPFMQGDHLLEHVHPAMEYGAARLEWVD